jgi:hypothetical protein
MLVCLAALLAAVVVVNWVVNPYGAWRSTVIDPAHRVTGTDRTEAGERVTTAYRVRAEQPTTLLVGSSRVVAGMYIEHGAQDGVFNASMSGASLAEIAAILRLAMANPRLRRVIWGVDFYAFDRRFMGFRHPETRVRLEGDERQVMALRIKETLLSMRALDDSRRVLLRAARGRRTGPFTAPVPWPEDVIRARLENPGRPGLDQADDAALKAQMKNWIDNYSGYRPSGRLLAVFREAVAEVRAAGIDVVLFVPPLSRCELEVLDQTGSWRAFQTWKRDLLTAGPYWDFSGYGKLDRMDSLFLDVAHFWPAVGHAMLREFVGLGCERCGPLAQLVREAGVWVDAATIEAHLARLEAMRTAVRSPRDGCGQLVAEMVRAETPAAGKGGGVRPAR